MNTHHYTIEGRRWFQRTYGNTYNTVRIYRDGELLVTLPEEYGYGDYYLQRAQDWLGANGHPELAERHSNGVPVVEIKQWLRDHGGNYVVSNVARERDL